MAHLSGAKLLSMMEPAMLAVAWLIFVRRKSYIRFPAFAAYLSCRLAVFAGLFLLWAGSWMGLLEKQTADSASYYLYWGGYLAGGLLAVLVIRSIFWRVLEPFGGLHRVGRVGFRWAAAMAMLIALVSALFPFRPSQDLLSEVTNCVMRGISVLELCLLAFILLLMQALRFSLKSKDFGIALGLGMIAFIKLGVSAFTFRHSTGAVIANYVSQGAFTLAAVVWAAYFVRPAGEEIVIRSAGTLSALGRWNEVANALTEPAAQVYLGTPAGSFFLDEVEKVVDRVMERNAATPAATHFE